MQLCDIPRREGRWCKAARTQMCTVGSCLGEWIQNGSLLGIGSDQVRLGTIGSKKPEPGRYRRIGQFNRGLATLKGVSGSG